MKFKRADNILSPKKFLIRNEKNHTYQLIESPDDIPHEKQSSYYVEATISERVGEEDLFQYIGKHGASPELAYHFGRQLCSALQHLHQKNIIHRDLKIENCFLNKDGGIKLGDFGLAKKIDDATQYDDSHHKESALHSNHFIKTQMIEKPGKKSSFCGTTEFMAPEMAKKNADSHFSLDIWGLGIVLLELTCNINPSQIMDHRITYGTLDVTTTIKNRNHFSALSQQEKKDTLLHHFQKTFQDEPDLLEIIVQLLDCNPENRPSLDDVKLILDTGYKRLFH